MHLVNSVAHVKVCTLLSSTLKQARMDYTTCSTNNSHATTNTNLHEYMYVTLSSEWQLAKSTTHSWTHDLCRTRVN